MGRDHAEIRYNLGVTAMRAGDVETGRRELERSLAIGPSALAWVAMGELRQRDGDARKAFAAYLWTQLGNLDRAEEMISRVITLAPERQDLRDTLGRIREMRAAQE